MLEDLVRCCDAPGCDRELSADHHRLTFRTAAGIRRVYECPCGAVTITVSRP